MKKNKPDAMIIDDFGNIYYSAASLNELKEKYKEELLLEKNAYNRMYNMYVEKDNVIKEVREEIIKDRKKNYGDLEKKAFYCNKTDKLLEILDKENE